MLHAVCIACFCKFEDGGVAGMTAYICDILFVGTPVYGQHLQNEQLLETFVCANIVLLQSLASEFCSSD